MKLAVCDDELIFCEQLSQKIERFYHSMDVVVYIYQNPRELLGKIMEDHSFFHAVFLDIEMPQMDGMQVAEAIRKSAEKMPIIFLTSHVEQMEEGYEVQAFRFLTKPLSDEKLGKALKALHDVLFDEKKIMISEDGISHFLYEKDILCVKAENVYLEVITKEKTYLIREKMKCIQGKLADENFFRVHRSYLINLEHVRSYQQNKVVLENRLEIPVSRNRREEFENRLLDFMRKKNC